MEKHDSAAISRCGIYIATITNAPLICNIKTINNSELVLSYNLDELLDKHWRSELHDFLPKREEDNMIESSIYWEYVIKGQGSTKLAILLKSLCLVIIIDIRKNMKPSIVHQTPTDGIEKIEWIPPVERNEADKNGAYLNSVQFLIFTRNFLRVKLFSLDCTQVVWQLERPLSSNIIIKPNENSKVWTIIQSLGKNRALNARLYYMYNSGSVSSVMYYLDVDTNSNSSMDIAWSNSGKFFSIFNSEDLLFGFHLRIYNALGVFYKGIDSGELPKKSPILDIKDHLDGFEDMGANYKPISLCCLEYSISWLAFGNKEYLFIAGISSEKQLETAMISVSSFGLAHKQAISLKTETIVWSLVTGATKKYKKQENTHINFTSENTFKIIQIIYQESKNYVLIQLDEALIILKIELKDQGIVYKMEAIIEVRSKLIKVSYSFMNPNEDYILIVFEDQICKYSFDEQFLKTVKYLQNDRILDISLIDVKDGCHLLIFESSSKEFICESIGHNKKDFNVQVNSPTKDKKPPQTVKKIITQILDSDTTNSLGSRVKRNRFQNYLGLLGNSSINEDATDTFNIQKKTKRNV